MIKKKSVILLLLFAQSLVLMAIKTSYVLLDYDKVFVVDVSIDTTLRINQLTGFDKNKTPRASKLHEVHCDFRILYLWKNNYVVRALVRDMKSIKKDSLNIDTISQRFFRSNAFIETDTNYYCGFNNHSFAFSSEGVIPERDPVYFYKGTYLIRYNDSVYIVDPYNIDILRCTPKTLSHKKPIYYSFPLSPVKVKNPYNINTDVDVIKNFIYQTLFIKRENVLIPDELPSLYDKYKKYKYDNLCCEGSDIIVKSIVNINGKASYHIDNKLIMFTIPPIIYHQQLCYIPHVLYLPNNQILTEYQKYFNKRKALSMFVNYYFKYKINSINGVPFEKFMENYVDDFTPTFKK